MLFVDEFCGIYIYIKFGADVTSQYEEALALYQRYRNDPFELLAAAYELGFLKGKQVKEAVA